MPDGNELAELKTALTQMKSTYGEHLAAAKEHSAEVEKLGKASAETMQKLDKINTDLASFEEVKSRIERVETAIKRGVVGEGKDDKGQDIEAKAAMDHYIRTGIDDKIQEVNDKKALSVNSDPDGGYQVLPDLNGRMVKRIYETSAIRQLASVQTITTDVLEGEADLDEAGAEWVNETTDPTDETTPRMAKWRIPVHEMATKPKATQKLLEDSMINIETWLMAKVQRKFMRTANAAYVKGDGDGKPTGFLAKPLVTGDDATGDTPWGKLGAILSGANGSFDEDLLVKLESALKEDYRANAVYAMNRQTLGAARLLKDGDGNFLWQPSFQLGTPASLNGYAVRIFEDMPAMAADSLSIAFGDFAEGYQIVDRLGLAVLRDPYTATPFVKFYTRMRTGGDVINYEAIKIGKLGT